MLFGVDVSVDTLNFTAELNSGVVDEDGLELHLASVDALPFGDGAFDIVTAVETYFFWPDLEKAIAEVARVLSPGGILMVASEITTSVYPQEKIDEMLEVHGARIVPDEVMMGLFDKAGIDGEVFVVGPGVLYRGVKRL